VGDCQTGATGSLRLKNKHERKFLIARTKTPVLLAPTSLAVVTAALAMSRYLKIFWGCFKKNQGKKISSPPGQNLDIANSAGSMTAMTFKQKSANRYERIAKQTNHITVFQPSCRGAITVWRMLVTPVGIDFNRNSRLQTEPAPRRSQVMR
jgi:hypothetical protein